MAQPAESTRPLTPEEEAALAAIVAETGPPPQPAYIPESSAPPPVAPAPTDSSYTLPPQGGRGPFTVPTGWQHGAVGTGGGQAGGMLTSYPGGGGGGLSLSQLGDDNPMRFTGPQSDPSAVPRPVGSASAYYGGTDVVTPPTGLNNPDYVITSYPSTGAEPTAQVTENFYTKGGSGRTPPDPLPPPFPASHLVPPDWMTQTGRDPGGSDQFRPGPPRDYIPGSTYIPQNPNPDPRVSFEDRLAEGRKAMAPGTTPGAGGYGRDPDYGRNPDAPYISPGLGAGSALSPGPLSRSGRPLAPSDPNEWSMVNPREPQDAQPGSTYVPRWIGRAPLGSPQSMYRPPVASEAYGGVAGRYTEPSTRPPGDAWVDTTYPATGAPETRRSTRYLPADSPGTVMQEGDPSRERVIDPTMVTPPGGVPWRRAQTLAQMEDARQARRLVGLFGGTDPRPPGYRYRPLPVPKGG